MNSTQYIIRLSESEATDFGRTDIGEQSPEQQVFTAVFGASGAIFMDGLALWLESSNGESAPYAAGAFRAIGATRTADLIQTALGDICPGGVPVDEDARAALVGRLTEAQQERLNEIDGMIYSTGEIIDDLLLDYVGRHPKGFGPVPQDITKLGEG